MKKLNITFKTRISAIYQILNRKTKKSYIGSAVNIYGRWKLHISFLKNKKHHSILLQRAWNKYGEDAFEFKILEVVTDSAMLFIREQFWMDKLQSYNPKFGYNISPVAGNQLGFKHTKETKVILSRKNRGYKHTQEAINKISEAGRRPCSPETKLKISVAQKGKPRPIKSVLKMRGRKFTEEHKLKLSLAKKGKPSPNKGKTFSEEWRHNLSLAHKKG